jgi:uncharacterized protein (TIGR00255 family)
VTVRVTVGTGSLLPQLLPNLEALAALKTAWEEAAATLGFSKSSVGLSFLVDRLASAAVAEMADADDLAALRPCLEAALEELSAMRSQEGAALAQDLRQRLSTLTRLIGDVEARSGDATAKLRETLGARLRDVLMPDAQLDERVMREIALFAEKVDISEELVRFRSHIAQYQQLLVQEGSGRKMDFLIQEMGREINTIGSKSMDSSIAHLIVDAKAELEKLREQVQNIL